MFRPRFEKVEKADVRERKEIRETERVVMTLEEEEERKRRQFINDMMSELFKDDFE